MTAQALPGNRNNKLLGLEVIRFVSALSVLIWHYQHFFYIANKPADFVKERQPLYSIFSLFYDYGYYGVQVFWCISGFIFFWKYKNAIAGKNLNPKEFFVLRFSRLYPLHFATLLLVTLLQAAYLSQEGHYFVYENNDIMHFILQLFLASNWGLEKGYSFNGPIWSISVEVLIYCFFFLALRYLSKSAWVNLAVLLVCVVAKIAKISTPVIDCLAFFYIGGLSAIALQYFEKTKYHDLLDALTLGAVFFLPIAAYATNLYQHKHFAFLFLLTYVPTLLFISAKSIAVPPGIQKTVEVAGNMTYSSYLVHFPIQLAIKLYFSCTNQATPYYSLTFFTGFMLATLLASYSLYRYFELPAQNLIRNRFR